MPAVANSDPYADLISAVSNQEPPADNPDKVDPYSDLIAAVQPSQPTQMSPEEMARTGMTNWEPNAATAGTKEYDPFTGKVASDKPLLSEEAVKKALSAVGQIGETEPQAPDPTQDQINQAIAERVAGLTSEKALSTFPMYAIPGYAEVQGLGGLAGIPDQLAQDHSTHGITGATLDAAMNALMLGHRLLPEGAPKSAEEAPAAKPEPPPIQRVSPETGQVFYDYEGRDELGVSGQPTPQTNALAGRTEAPSPVQANVLQDEVNAGKVPTPDEFAQRVAESPTTRPGDEPVGQQQATSEPGVARPENQEVGASSGQPAGTSNRLNAEIYGENAVPSGEGVDTGELLDNARSDIRSGAVDPYSVLSRTISKGIATPSEYAALAAEHERLVNEAVAKQKAGAPDAPEAAQAAEDFANAIQPHKTAASDLMRLFQGDVNYDLSTPFGMEQMMKSEIGRGFTDAERPKFTRMAKDIDRAQTDVGQSVARSDARVQRAYAKVRDIPIEEAANRVKQLLNDCLV